MFSKSRSLFKALKAIVTRLFFGLCIFALVGLSPSVLVAGVIEKIPSEWARQEIKNYPKFADKIDSGQFSVSDESVRSRLREIAWRGSGHLQATNGHAYLVALAIDLTNALPADIDRSGDGLNPGEIPGKGSETGEIRAKINWAMSDDGEKTLREHPELSELIWSLRFFDQQGHLDKADDPPSITKIDILIPSQLPALREYLAAKLGTVAGNNSADTTTTATNTVSVPATSATAQPSEQQPTPKGQPPAESDAAAEPGETPASNTPWGTVAMVVFVLAAVGGFVLLRRRKNN